MDAMQKRRMWKVVIVHFLLTVFCFFGLVHLLFKSFSFDSDSWINLMSWFLFVSLLILQPEFLLAVILQDDGPNHILPPLIWWVFIPIWSICFGWIYVKFTGWLNHFPVLGKKVF
jgi:hypothetical protein